VLTYGRRQVESKSDGARVCRLVGDRDKLSQSLCVQERVVDSWETETS